MDPLDAVGGLSAAGVLSMAVGGLVYAVRKLADRKAAPSLRPGAAMVPSSSTSGQIRAVADDLEEELEERRKRRVEHEAMVSMQADNARAVVFLEAAVELLADILDEQRERDGKERQRRPTRPDGKYRQKLPSHRGGE